MRKAAATSEYSPAGFEERAGTRRNVSPTASTADLRDSWI